MKTRVGKANYGEKEEEKKDLEKKRKEKGATGGATVYFALSTPSLCCLSRFS